MSNDYHCLFTSEYSLGRSILTLEPEGEIKDDSPVSIPSVAKTYNIELLFLIENNLTGFVKAYKNIQKQFIFGLKIVAVQDINQKNEESFLYENKVIILLKNAQAYYDVIKIFSEAATLGKYYVPRTSWDSLKKYWTKNLKLAIPFYDSFIHGNLLQNKECVPDFPDEPVFFIEDHELPFDHLIGNAIKEYCRINNNELINTHSCFYYKTEDVSAYQTFRCIQERTTLHKPNLSHFGSNQFSFESYLKKAGQNVK